MQLKGKTVFITGGTGGIGVPLVNLMERQGAVVTAYNRQKSGAIEDNLEAICLGLRKSPPDILLNLAGTNQFSYAEDQDYQKLVSVNLIVPMQLSQAVLPAMIERRSGHIITVGSMSALIPLPHVSGYVAAKAGLKAFTDSLRRELEGTGIDITHVVPRAVKTQMNAGAANKVNLQTGIHSDDPSQIASVILNAILKRQREVRVGWPERVYAFLNAIFPSLIDVGLGKTRKAGEAILQNPQAVLGKPCSTFTEKRL
ncbi:MAG: SDR family NAD(P)-dependent oxidoreductase [Sneathiella sp.]